MGYEKNQKEYIYFEPFFATYRLNLIGYYLGTNDKKQYPILVYNTIR